MKFNYEWYLEDNYKNYEKNNLNVFGTFICGGGSTMGYKLAGFNHLGGVEIDNKIAEIYKINHNPKYLYTEDIRKFNQRNDIPDELYNLDILDGSPPCSTFSMSGSREKAWGREKIFKEGQAKQTLDDLVFVYLETINKLKPKIAILENVKGLISGNAKAYVKEIVKKLNEYKYDVQLFLLNSASMGVPQKRERVFFICKRNDLKFKPLILNFNEKPVIYGKIRIPGDDDMPFSNHDLEMWNKRTEGDKDYGDILKRIKGKSSNWSSKFIYDNQICSTILSTDGSKLISVNEKKHLSKNELKMCGSYPLDYNFQDVNPKYLIGMSVPPVMTAQIAHQIYLQWLKR